MTRPRRRPGHDRSSTLDEEDAHGAEEPRRSRCAARGIRCPGHRRAAERRRARGARSGARASSTRASARASPTGSTAASSRPSWCPSSASWACSGMTLDGLRMPRPQRRRVRPRGARARGRRLRHPHVRVGAGLARDGLDPPLGNRGAEAGVAAADGARRGDRLLRPHRAGCRLRPVEHEDVRPPRRRRLDPHRLEALDRARHHRAARGGVGADRRRRARLHRADGCARASTRRRSSRRARCGRRSSASCTSTTSGCPPTRCCPALAVCAVRSPR